jgi:ribonuclease PH
MNIVMGEDGGLIEVQGTAEGATFDRATLNQMLDLAERGISALFSAQRQALAQG